MWPVIDPSDRVDFVLDCSAMLEPEEFITSFYLTSRNPNLNFDQSNGHAVELIEGKRIRFWPNVVDDELEDQKVLIHLSLVTTNTPPRIKNRTLSIAIAQQ